MADEQFFLIVVVDGQGNLPRVKAGPDLVPKRISDVVEFPDADDIDFAERSACFSRLGRVLGGRRCAEP